MNIDRPELDRITGFVSIETTDALAAILRQQGIVGLLSDGGELGCIDLLPDSNEEVHIGSGIAETHVVAGLDQEIPEQQALLGLAPRLQRLHHTTPKRNVAPVIQLEVAPRRRDRLYR